MREGKRMETHLHIFPPGAERNGRRGEGRPMSGRNQMLTTYSGRANKDQVKQGNLSERTYLAHAVCASAEPLGGNGEVIYRNT